MFSGLTAEKFGVHTCVRQHGPGCTEMQLQSDCLRHRAPCHLTVTLGSIKPSRMATHGGHANLVKYRE